MVRSSAVQQLLVVDDVEACAISVAHLLRAHGFRVTVATTAKQALAPDIPAPDLAVLDVMMPNLDGIAVALLLRERWPDLPVAFLTGGCSESLLARATKLGPVLEKPFDTRKLLETVGVLLSRCEEHSGP